MDQAATRAAPLPREGSIFDQKFGGRAKRGPASKLATGLFAAVVLAGLAYAIWRLMTDPSQSHEQGALPYLLLGVALLIALGFEFVNGFHDTANAVATVIYTHSLSPNVAVVWSGMFNFLGVLTSSGAVAFSVISLLPVELILQVSSQAGFAMVFALLIAAIIWNLGTWALGLPASSSHTLIGSIIGVGVGVANSLMHGQSGTAGVDWGQATQIGYALLLSPLVGFCCAAGMYLLLQLLVRWPELYAEPEGSKPPPRWIRGLLIFTCTGVSFAHSSNDGQKGIGLIMLILVGTVPTVYALNRTADAPHAQHFVEAAAGLDAALAAHGGRAPVEGDPRLAVTAYVRDKALQPETVPALRQLSAGIAGQVHGYGELRALPDEAVPNVRNHMYLAGEALG
jgi:PiT family inorganic phosphate transporter